MILLSSNPRPYFIKGNASLDALVDITKPFFSRNIAKIFIAFRKITVTIFSVGTAHKMCQGHNQPITFYPLC